MSKKFVLIITSILLLTTISYGQEMGFHAHDGFYMRFLAGPSYTSSQFDGADNSMEIKGLSGTFRVQIGSTIANNLILYGELGGASIQNPDIEIGGNPYNTEDTKASITDIGAGITYYFMPSNFYITGTVLASQYTVEYTGGNVKQKGESDRGFGIFIGAGKEWWVSKDWALGLAGFMAYSNVPDKGNSDVTIGSTTFGVLFSATYQ